MMGGGGSQEMRYFIASNQVFKQTNKKKNENNYAINNLLNLHFVKPVTN